MIVVGEIDLSFGAMYGLAANSLAVMWIMGGVPIYVAIPLAIGLGGLVGVFNGMLTTWLKIPSFIVTLGSYNLLYGLSLYVTNASTFNPVYPPEGYPVAPDQLAFFNNLTKQFGSHQFSAEVFWMLGLALVVGFLLHRSLFGFRLMAIGGNPVAGQPSPAFRAQIQDPGLRPLRHAGRRPRASSISPSSRRPSPTSASPDLPGLRRRHHRRGQPLRRQGAR